MSPALVDDAEDRKTKVPAPPPPALELPGAEPPDPPFAPTELAPPVVPLPAPPGRRVSTCPGVTASAADTTAPLPGGEPPAHALVLPPEPPVAATITEVTPSGTVQVSSVEIVVDEGAAAAAEMFTTDTAATMASPAATARAFVSTPR